MRALPRFTAPVAMACAAAALIVIVRAQVIDPNAACISNAVHVAVAIDAYVLDYDETFPPMHTNAELQRSTGPYAGNLAIYTCPVTRVPYWVVGALSFRRLSEFRDPEPMPMVGDATPHADLKYTIARYDTRVSRGGVLVQDPVNTCASHAHKLALGMSLYAQDYDGYLPPMQTQADFQTQIRPYGRFRYTLVCPETQQPYLGNLTLGGHSLADFATPDAVEVLRDSVNHTDGTRTYGYLSGRTDRR